MRLALRPRHGLVAMAIVLLTLSLALAACSGGGGGGGGGNTVVMSEYKYDPPNVTVKANQAVTINLRNTGTLVHDWVVQGMPQPVQGELQPGRNGTVSFTPTQPGTYKIVCTQPGHEQSGMVGQLIVEP
jgi:uncharacterized cupredoxin-like copper-binding protein